MCRNIGKVDDMMSQIQEQAQLANEVSEAISTGIITTDIDDVRMKYMIHLWRN
jgi:hypothetical protein